MKKSKIAILIVTYNRLTLLKECLEAVLHQSMMPADIFIVNNHSTDGTEEYLQSLYEYQEPAIYIVNTKENLGGAGGFEVGVKEALKHRDYKFLLFIDDDAILKHDFLERIELAIKDSPQVSLFAGSVLCGGVIDTNHRRKISNRLIFSESWIPKKFYGSRFYCELATFCGFIADRKVMEIAGAPRGDYFIWYDDTEYCLRCEKILKKMGRISKILVVPDAKINHKSKMVNKDGDILMRTDWRSRYGWKNRYDVAKRYLGAVTAFVVRMEYFVLLLISKTMRLSKNKRIREQGSFNVKMITEVLKSI